MTKVMQFFFRGGGGGGEQGVLWEMGKRRIPVKDTKNINKLSPVISGVAILSTVNSHCTMY